MFGKARLGSTTRGGWWLCLVTLAGCANIQPQGGFSDVQQLIAERMQEPIYWSQGTAADAEVQQRIGAMLGEALTSDTAVQIALLNNRGLQATYEDLGVAQADLVQAGLLKNPVFSVERRFSGQAAEFHIIQDFLDAFLIPLRKRAAQAAFDAEKARVAEAILNLATEVRATFYTLQGAQQLVEMRRSVVRSTEASAEAADALHTAGNISELDWRIEQKAGTQARLDLATAEDSVVQHRERLNALLGLWGEQTQWKVSVHLPELPAGEIQPQGLEALAVEQRLDLAAGRQGIVLAAESLGLTSVTRFVPDVNIGLHSEREADGFDSLGPSLDLAIPIFDQGQAKMARSAALLRQRQERYVALGIEVRSQVRAAYARMSAAGRRANFYRRTVLPLHAEILHHTQLHYNAMQAGVFQLLLARQAEIDAGREYIETLRDYWIARAELERAVGGRLAGLTMSPAEPPAGAETPPVPSPPHEHQHHGDQS